MRTIPFSPSITNTFAQSTEIGILIDVGWTVAIPKETAIDYVRNYNKKPNHGFFEHNGKVCLTHGDAKIMLSMIEADAIIALIRAAYLGE